MSTQRLKFGATLCATLLSAATLSATLPVAQADPAPHGERQGDSPAKDKPKDVDINQAEVDRLLNSPIPKNVDGALGRLHRISRVASKNSDLVEELKGKIAQQLKAVDQAHKAVEKSDSKVEAAQRSAEESKDSVTEVSRAAYRGASVDPVSAIAGASGPAAAMDRSAYLSALSQEASGRVEAVTQAMQEARDVKSSALRAKAKSDFRLGELKAQEKELDESTKTLDRLKKEVTSTVDGFSPEERRRWVDRNGPIDVDVKEFLGELEKTVKKSGTPANADYSGAVAAAMSKLGAPYGWGAAGPDTFDCSGLMLWAYQQIGKEIPRTSQAQLAGGTSVSTSDLQPGDLVAYYPGATHIGMYIGDGKLVHASDYGIPVQVVPVDSMPMVGAVRY